MFIRTNNTNPIASPQHGHTPQGVRPVHPGPASPGPGCRRREDLLALGPNVHRAAQQRCVTQRQRHVVRAVGQIHEIRPAKGSLTVLKT